MREVVPGDVVFSYANAAVQGAGFAVSFCYTCPRPAEFGHIGEVWDVVGWRVDVRFQRFTEPIRPKHHLQVLEPMILREAYPPIRRTGDGLQNVYLTSISEGFAHTLLTLSGTGSEVFRVPVSGEVALPAIESTLVGQQESEDIVQEQIVHAELPSTTRVALIKARVGQGLFKERVPLMPSSA